MLERVMLFRIAQKKDASRITAFQLAMAWETENLKLDEKTCSLGVQAVFENPNLGQYHVCEEDSRVFGSLLIVTEWSDWRNGAVWWIHSVYLKPELRGKSIFTLFYSYIKSLTEADEKVRGLRLYVDHSNTNAQAVYKKLGMNDEHYRLFEWMKTF